MLVNVDVTFVIRNIVRGISESLSEACNQVMSLPPRHEHPCTRDFEIIELDDTSDDGDLVSSDGESATRLLADMRVETANSVLHTSSSMPGRVEDDNDEQSFEDVFEGTLGVSPSSSLVRKVNDDPADDEREINFTPYCRELERAMDVSILSGPFIELLSTNVENIRTQLARLYRMRWPHGKGSIGVQNATINS
ncbi:unnamed protein product [Angiostrongylus costaricensis]|uniref:Envelope-like protein n=1 Tax=Angiostrongylus costaricensis TaxID=334426 RepID=A0A0R3Q1G1_ANGCS|nr:unnamed protein product [Angiostrongylus costaricensis]